MAKQTSECPKCGGAGRISAFAHIESGACFRCGGSGKVAYRVSRKANVDTTPVAPASERIARMVRSLETIVSNSNGGIIPEHCAYSTGMILAAKAILAELSGDELATWTAKAKVALGWQNAHLLAA